MEGPKWEGMKVDCLVNIFGRVGMESLVLDVPLVCKSWYEATRDPLCWKQLLFPKLDLHSHGAKSRLKDACRLDNESSVTSFVKRVVKRSRQQATTLALPVSCTEEALLYAAEECPELRTLVLRFGVPDDRVLRFGVPDDHVPRSSMIVNSISKWKNLEFIRLEGRFYMQGILDQVSQYCKNFVGLGATNTNIDLRAALAIVTLVPKIKHLDLRGVNIRKENLMKILKGCRELEYLDARDCIGFDEGDKDIIHSGSHIRKFMREGSRTGEFMWEASRPWKFEEF